MRVETRSRPASNHPKSKRKIGFVVHLAFRAFYSELVADLHACNVFRDVASRIRLRTKSA